MIKAKTIMTLDTETVGLQPVNFVYDLGYIIHNKKGEIKVKRSFLIREIVTDGTKMMSAFFAKKIFSYYIPALDAGLIRLVSWSDVVAQIAADVIEFDVDIIAAYNANFDIGALRATAKVLNTGKILPRPVELLCIWEFACNTLLNRRGYHTVAVANEWISEAGNVRTTAECTYRFITGEYDFVESHTALHDAEIETQILTKCFATKKKIPYNSLAYMPWQVAQKIAA